MASVGQAEVNGLLKRDDAVGPPVHTFDPAASSEEKGAAAGKGRDQLKSINGNGADSGKELPVQKGPSNVIPTITVQDTDEGSKTVASLTEQSAQDVQDEAAAIPGAYSTPRASTIPDWYRVGWRQAAGIDDKLSEGEERDKGVLDMFLAEQFYGDWYHNAAIIVFAVFASHFLTRFNFGWGWLFIILAFCNTYYSTSLERVRRRSRDDIQRELVKTRLISEHESADWINNFLDRFWLIYEPVLSATIVSSVDQILSTNTPAFLDSLRLTTFTLGTKAPHIDKVRTFPKTADDIIMMDWGISFTPNDVEDLTPRQLASKVNPKIVLSIRLGKGFATASMPVLVEDISFNGLMRIRMKLMSNFPHVQIVDFCFLEKPVIDYVLKPIGGDTFGFDIANVPGLSSFIRDMTHGILGPMMYDPNVFTLNLEQMLSGKPLDTAVGIIQVTVRSARGIKGTKIGGGTPDPYIALTINDRAELARTKHQENTFNPTWNETKFILVNNLQESLVLNLWDYNDHRKDFLMGSSTFELSKLLDDATQEDMNSSILKDGKDRGELKYDVSYYPVLEAAEGEELPDTTVGIVRLTVHQAKELDASKSMSGDLNPLAKVFLGDSRKPSHTTPAFKHTNSPVWESAHEFLCSDKASSIVTIKVIDDRDILKDPVIGYMSIKLTDLLDSMGEAGRDWFPLSACQSGKIRVSAQWKPLSMAGSFNSAEQYTPPIGVVKLTLDKATDVKNVEATLGGKSLLLDVMDYQNLTKDRSLGTVDLHVNELAQESKDYRYPVESKGQKVAVDPIRLHGNAYKGELHYTALFIPALALNGVAFDTKSSPKAELEDDNVSVSSSDHGAPVALTIKSANLGSNGNGFKSAPSSPTTSPPASKPASPTPPPNEDGTMQEVPSTEVPKGVDMTIEELLSQQSGIVVFNVVSGQLAKKSRLEVLLDEGYWPCFSTPKARSTHAQWDFTGEGFIKEIDFNRIWLRLNTADEGDRDDVLAEWKGDAKMFLKKTLNGVATFDLANVDDEYASKISIEARYIPVPVKLEPRESINSAQPPPLSIVSYSLPNSPPQIREWSASNYSTAGSCMLPTEEVGKSDPYAVFSLNGDKVFKSQTIKKTVNPDWNETFNVEVPSRVGSNFRIEVFDWDQMGASDSLGEARIDLEEIEPFQAFERILNLSSAKHGEEGHVRIRMTFQPSIIARSRKNTSTFSTAGRAVTQIGALPVTAGLSAGKGVLHGVTGLFKHGHHEEQPESKELPSGQASQPVGASGHATAFPVASGSEPSEPGTLRVTILDAKDLSGGETRPYATIRVGDKEFKTKHVARTATPEWNETFTFSAGPHTPKLFAWIHDHKTIGKDKDLGEGEVDKVHRSGVTYNLIESLQPMCLWNFDREDSCDYVWILMRVIRAEALRRSRRVSGGIEPLQSLTHLPGSA
ncbi:hypothetical protein H0H87_006252 [Tephrocybe sp. NHM501043]|nr:hypothetical protein H0H87_006252 [Tephrocybe sp. NHM501043]